MAEIFRLDRENDFAGLAKYLDGLKYQRLQIVHTLVTLATNGRFRSAHLLAKLLMSAGDGNPAVHLAWCVGGAMFGDAADESMGVQSLVQSVGRLNPDQLRTLRESIVEPVFSHAMTATALSGNQALNAKLLRIRELAEPRAREAIEFAPAATDGAADDAIASALAPFWRSQTMTETLQFVRESLDSPPMARLLFRPEQVLRLASATRKIAFQSGRDYVVDLAAGIVGLPEGSAIPFKTRDEVSAYVKDKASKTPDDPSALHRQQVEVVYNHTPGQWIGHVPSFAEAELPRTLKTLRAGARLKILLMGDSIAEGYGSSKFAQVPPNLPGFGEQVAGGLAQVYRCPVVLDNVAHTTWPAYLGAEQAVRENLGERRPGLVIVAFGMNDVALARMPEKRRHGPSEYADGIRAIIATIRAGAPDAEFLLVSSMHGNPESEYYPADQFPLYRDAIRPLTGPGIALADMTAVSAAILARKGFLAISDGLNHPNDFGHRVYAQTILGLLVDQARAESMAKPDSVA